VTEWLAAAARGLADQGIPSSRLEAEVLLSHAMNVDRVWLAAHPEAATPAYADKLLVRRLRHEPLAYLTGWREFYGRRFSVQPGVLIPRQETETLVAAALELAGDETVLDLGTGSGCLAVTLALERPGWRITASDVSPLALDIARKNARALGAEVEFVLSDRFAGLAERAWDLVVCNPPYVASGANLDLEISRHEPPEALYSGPSGYEFYELLAKEAAPHLTATGRLTVEAGDGMASGIADLFRSNRWKVERMVPDLGGTARALVLRPR